MTVHNNRLFSRGTLIWFSLTLILVLGIAARSYKITAPIADWHSWRQADTAAVARNFLKFGFDPLRPRYDDLSNIQSGKDNPQGWRMVEFPLYQLTAAGMARVFGGFSIEVWLRIVSILCSVGTALLVAWLVSRTVNTASGVVTGVLLAILPYNVYYGRTILPEVPLVFLSTLSIVTAYMYSAMWPVHHPGRSQRTLLFFLSALSGSMALLVKPTGVFLLLPAVLLFMNMLRTQKRAILLLGLWALIVAVPVLLWRQWIANFPEGIPAYGWLFNSGNIRFKGAWFYWLWAKRLGELILGYWGLIPFALGVALRPSKDEHWLFHAWLFGIISYWVVVASGNVQHDYYQIVAIPPILVFTAKGIVHLMRERVLFHPLVAKGVALVSVMFMLAFSWYTIRTYYWINKPEIVEAGRSADALLPADAKVIASYNGDTTFLYQINRQGWPLGFDIDKKIAMGATHYVTISPGEDDGETMDLASRYEVLIRNERFAIIDLRKLKPRSGP